MVLHERERKMKLFALSNEGDDYRDAAVRRAIYTMPAIALALLLVLIWAQAERHDIISFVMILIFSAGLAAHQFRKDYKPHH